MSSPLQFTHSAAYEAGLVLRNALFGLRVRRRTYHIPWVTFSDPELAQVGFTKLERVKNMVTDWECPFFVFCQ